MIIGQGIDIVEIQRVGKVYKIFKNNFLEKIFSSNEMKFNNYISDLKKIHFSSLASRFAAKEAAVKALGTGFRNGIKFKEIEILKDDIGKPIINFNGIAKKRIESILGNHKIFKVQLSISHEKKYAIAIVTISIL